MSRFKRSQAKYVKQAHRITNWPAYDQALVTRGSWQSPIQVPSIKSFDPG